MKLLNDKNEAINNQNNEKKEVKIDLNKAKTYKIPSRPEKVEEEFEKLSKRKKYSFRFKESRESNNDSEKISGALTISSTNTTDKNKEKKAETEANTEELEFSPENFTIAKVIKLPKSNLKWFLFKKVKKKNEKDLKIKTYNNRRYRCYSHRREEDNIIKDENENNNSIDSYSNYFWKPQKHRKEFLDFGTFPINDSTEKQKKIEELEKNNKELEEKLNKKEKDLNRLNVNYAKMIKNSKNPENTEEKMAEKLEKLRQENKKLNATVNKLKSEQQFIGLSFIADDLEAEQFIDDNCFEDILDNLVDKDKDKEKEGNKNDIKNKMEKTTIDPSNRHSNTRKYYKSKRKNE
jgi:hypothetical protein